MSSSDLIETSTLKDTQEDSLTSRNEKIQDLTKEYFSIRLDKLVKRDQEINESIFELKRLIYENLNEVENLKKESEKIKIQNPKLATREHKSNYSYHDTLKSAHSQRIFKLPTRNLNFEQDNEIFRSQTERGLVSSISTKNFRKPGEYTKFILTTAELEFKTMKIIHNKNNYSHYNLESNLNLASKLNEKSLKKDASMRLLNNKYNLGNKNDNKYFSPQKFNSYRKINTTANSPLKKNLASGFPFNKTQNSKQTYTTQKSNYTPRIGTKYLNQFSSTDIREETPQLEIPKETPRTESVERKPILKNKMNLNGIKLDDADKLNSNKNIVTFILAEEVNKNEEYEKKNQN